MYGQKDPDIFSYQNLTVGTDTQTNTGWTVGLDHSFSKRTEAYALYTELDVDNGADKNLNDWTGFSLGMIHDF